MNAAVFLDRDNTIIQNDGDLGDPAQVRLIQGAASAIASLKGLNYRIIVVTNQGGVARGKYSEADVDRVNEKINDLIRANSGVFIDRFYYCPYHPEGTVDRYRRDHPWRKPRPGMLLQAARDLGLDLRQSWMIGDQLRDVQAGFSAGVVPILLSPDGKPPGPASALPPGVTATPEDRNAASKMVAIEPVRDFFVVRSLIEAVRLVGQKSRPTNVTAAMKTERIEVIPKPQPRVATASFDAASVQVVESERGQSSEIAVNSVATKQGEDAADLQAVTALRDAAVVSEAAPDAVAAQLESPSPTKRKGRSEKAKPSRESSESMREGPHAKAPLTEQVIAEIESRVAEPLIDSRSRDPEVATVPAAQARQSERKSETPAIGTTLRAPVVVSAKEATAESVKQEEKPHRPVLTKKRQEHSGEGAAIAEKADAPAVPEKSHEAISLESSSATPQGRLGTPSAGVPASSTATAADPVPLAPGPTASPEQTLRQILQELRSQRKVAGDFHYAVIVAIVLQMVAAVCLVAALLMGSGDNDLFFRWISCAIMLQLATLAMLMFRK